MLYTANAGTYQPQQHRWLLGIIIAAILTLATLLLAQQPVWTDFWAKRFRSQPTVSHTKPWVLAPASETANANVPVSNPSTQPVTAQASPAPVSTTSVPATNTTPAASQSNSTDQQPLPQRDPSLPVGGYGGGEPLTVNPEPKPPTQ
jgi:hypothetical protein